jgi:NADPH:quinone reductase-like Zn-dependent oxidoreductase
MVYHTYGPPDVLQLADIPAPVPGELDVLVKIHAASANPLDWHYMRGTPRFARLGMGFFKPKANILGADFAGRVNAVGSKVTRFQPGDEVYGSLANHGLGAFAEFAVLPETAAMVRKPTNLSYNEAAAVPVAAITALQALRDTGQIQPGQRVLINGAAGGVGTFAVQLAKYFGTEVTGVCSTRNVEQSRSLGADHVIDYTQTSLNHHTQHYDLLLDNVGNLTVAECKRLLTDPGRAVIIGFTSLGLLFQAMVVGPLTSRRGGKQVGAMGTARTNQDDFGVLNELLEAGKIKPIIDRYYPLAEVPDAIRYLETGHARAKVVITVADDAG